MPHHQSIRREQDRVNALAERPPLGSCCVAGWVNYLAPVRSSALLARVRPAGRDRCFRAAGHRAIGRRAFGLRHGVDTRNAEFDSVANMTMLNAFAEQHSDLALSYERHGREIIVALNVTAADADEATALGQTLLLQAVPAPPETTVTGFEALPLKAEPDFT